MPRYRLKKEHYLQDKKAKVEPQFYEKGAEVEWAGTPSLHMDPIDKQAKERVEARVADFQEKRKEAAQRRTAMGWSSSYERNLAHIITRPDPSNDAPAQSASGSGARTRKAA
ncbi:MAG: hypothetical protein LC750_00485 [Actinobacteria bacterium]|nr:hypothetical protein [Actinomycetota bacterium]